MNETADTKQLTYNASAVPELPQTNLNSLLIYDSFAEVNTFWMKFNVSWIVTVLYRRRIKQKSGVDSWLHKAQDLGSHSLSCVLVKHLTDFSS